METHRKIDCPAKNGSKGRWLVIFKGWTATRWSKTLLYHVVLIWLGLCKVFPKRLVSLGQRKPRKLDRSYNKTMFWDGVAFNRILIAEWRVDLHLKFKQLAGQYDGGKRCYQPVTGLALISLPIIGSMVTCLKRQAHEHSKHFSFVDDKPSSISNQGFKF